MSTHEDDLRKEIVTLKVGNIQDARELHLLLKVKLDFPGFYGMNWDAFWDAITGLVELPETLSFDGWDKLTTVLPDDSQTLSDLLRKFNEKHPSWHCKVVYK